MPPPVLRRIEFIEASTGQSVTARFSKSLDEPVRELAENLFSNAFRGQLSLRPGAGVQLFEDSGCSCVVQLAELIATDPKQLADEELLDDTGKLQIWYKVDPAMPKPGATPPSATTTSVQQ